jgi:hypothetical protein
LNALGSRIGQRVAIAVALVMLLNASQCSFGGHELFSGFGQSTSQTSIAPLSAFGSVFVGGTEYADAGASVALDGLAADELELRPGQIATVEATIASGATTGNASSVAISRKLIGPVSATDPGSGSFTMLGQTVQMTGDTSIGTGIAPADVSGLSVGETVLVDGYRTSTGLIASRVDPAGFGQAPRVAGVVSGLNGLGQQFQLGGTTIDYSRLSGGLPPLIRDGSYVVASGGTVTAAATLQPSAVAPATESVSGASGDRGLVRGAVTRFGSASDFDVAGQTVSTGSSTSFAGGLSTDIAADRELEVAGQYDGSGALLASSVQFAPAARFRVVGPLAAVSSSAGTLSIAGITISTDARTRWEDFSAAALHVFGLSHLGSGDWVEVRGVAGVGQSASAHVVERRNLPNPAYVELQAVPSVLANPSLTLVGVTVDTSNANFTDASGQSLTRSAFFAAAGGRVVRVAGAFIGTTLTAATVALRP